MPKKGFICQVLLVLAVQEHTKVLDRFSNIRYTKDMTRDREAETLKEREQHILAAEEKIEQAEAHIEAEEKKIEKVELAILENSKNNGMRSIFDGELTAPERYFVRMRFVRKLAKHKLLFSLLATVGVVLVWRGIWHTVDSLPIISAAIISLLAGIAILWLIGRYTDLR